MKERLDKLVKIYDVRTIVMVFLGMLFIAIYVWMALSSKVADVRFNNEEATLLRDGWTVCVNGSSQEVTRDLCGNEGILYLCGFGTG